MGAAADKPAGSAISGCSCSAPQVVHSDAEPMLVRRTFAADPQAEQAEFARIIESLARPPHGASAAMTDAAQLSSAENVGSARAPTSEPALRAGSCCREDMAEYEGGEMAVPDLKPYAGLSVLELTTEDRTFLQPCSTDQVLGLIEFGEESTDIEHASIGLPCRGAGDGSWGFGIPGFNAQPLESAIQMMAQLRSSGCAENSRGIGPSVMFSDPDSATSWNVSAMPSTALCDTSSRNCVNGSTCVGQWTGNLLDGYGIERWPDGSVFVGDFRAGQKQGSGRLTLVSGSSYEGEFERDRMHGEGVYLWSDGRGYSGQWSQNCIGPNGKMRWSDGRSYAGAFVEGRMHGHGKFHWPDGRSFAGQWHTGRQHGSGAIRNLQGSERECLWQHGEFARWLSNPKTQAEEEQETVAEPPISDWEIPSSARLSPRVGLSPRDAGGEVLRIDGEGEQLLVENCSLGRCKAVGLLFAL